MSRKKSELGSREGRAFWAARVKDRRIELGLRQEDLAAEADVSRTTLIDIEAGRLVPQTGTLLRLLDALGLNPATEVEFSEDTQLWLGVIGGLIEALPSERRGRAGQAAVSAITLELKQRPDSVGAATDDDFEFEANPPRQGDLDLAAKRGKRK